MADQKNYQYNFRQHLPDLGSPRFTTMAKQDAHEYAKGFLEGGQPYWLYALYKHWRSMFKEPFKGVTTDGIVQPNLFEIQDEGVPVESIVRAAEAVVATCDETQKEALSYHVDSPEWRSWSNPEFLISDKGIRLDEINAALRDTVFGLMRATLSSEGYEKAVAAMRINHFLGELVNGVKVMNEFSYNLVLFGEPCAERPWGWALYGHHLCLNVFLYRGQIVISPWFTGAEPNIIDQGPYKGTRILHEEERLGLKLMQGLSSDLQKRAQVYKLMNDPAMPEGRWNKDDQRHLCGAYRDNRVVPYEGPTLKEFTREQQDLVWSIAEQYLLYLPERSRWIRLEQLKSFTDETRFCWIGGFGDDDPFYFRIQSPVVIIEFDHHSGVFLTNGEPAKFHIHTILRTPNAGDYGMALRPLIPVKNDKFLAVL